MSVHLTAEDVERFADGEAEERAGHLLGWWSFALEILKRVG